MLLRTPSIPPSEAAASLAAGELQLVDVREASELAGGAVPGAVHIPLGRLPEGLAQLDRSRPVAFLCRSGSRSASATRMARRAGLDAANVRGGITAWSRAGLSLTTDRPRGAS